jgi:hypothetical protein
MKDEQQRLFDRIADQCPEEDGHVSDKLNPLSYVDFFESLVDVAEVERDWIEGAAYGHAGQAPGRACSILACSCVRVSVR